MERVVTHCTNEANSSPESNEEMCLSRERERQLQTEAQLALKRQLRRDPASDVRYAPAGVRYSRSGGGGAM